MGGVGGTELNGASLDDMVLDLNVAVNHAVGRNDFFSRFNERFQTAIKPVACPAVNLC